MLDASAVAALIFGEPEAERVASWIGEGSAVAPALLDYEVANICWKKLSRYPKQRQQLLEAHTLVARMDVRRLDVLHDEVVLLAEETGLTAYDAAYLWLARALAAEVVSLDEKVLRAARAGGADAIDSDRP